MSQSPLHLLHGIILKFSVLLHSKAGLFIKPAKAPANPPPTPLPTPLPPISPPEPPISPPLPPIILEELALVPAAGLLPEPPPLPPPLPLPSSCCIIIILIIWFIWAAVKKKETDLKGILNWSIFPVEATWPLSLLLSFTMWANSCCLFPGPEDIKNFHAQLSWTWNFKCS